MPVGATALVNGSFDAATPVQVDGLLGGSGSVGTVTVSATGTVAPGNSPGILGVGNTVFNTGSKFTVGLNGASGTGYDQLAVTGTIDLGGATLAGSLGFGPGSGAVFTIVDNDGVEPVTGTFNGLAGTTVTIGATNFTISYTGGTGSNDVTLTAPGTAKAPTATIKSTAARLSGRW